VEMLKWCALVASSKHGRQGSTTTALTCHWYSTQVREPCGQRFRWLNFQEGYSFRHFPSDKCDQYQYPTKMKLISLILRFTAVLLQLVDEVTHPVHLHSFYTLPYEVYYKSSDLCQTILFEEITSYKLTSYMHCTILDGGYLVASLSLLYITIDFLYALC
jgi:hypothetical protein